MNSFTHILLGHGGGGALMDQLLNEVVRPAIANPILNEGLDSGILDLEAALKKQQSKLALTLDSYVVTPWRFPGGDIGRLSVCGTVNDLAVCGARPLGLALGLILAEGFERSVLEQIMQSIHTAADEAVVKVVTGDTKVVARGQCDGIFITTAGVGLVASGQTPSPRHVRPGDKLLINGTIGDHGMAVMLAREMPQMRSAIRSDVAPLSGLIQRLQESDIQVRFMRDATRAGVAGLAADLASATGLHLVLSERALPVRAETSHAAELLGLDVLEIANEAKVVVVVAPEDAAKAIEIMKAHPLGRDAAIIGEVTDEQDGLCELLTRSGGRRIVQKPLGEQLPRIC